MGRGFKILPSRVAWPLLAILVCKSHQVVKMQVFFQGVVGCSNRGSHFSIRINLLKNLIVHSNRDTVSHINIQASSCRAYSNVSKLKL